MHPACWLLLQEREACLTALKAGYGKQFYHITSGPARTVEHRVQQRRGQVLVEDKDGWGALVRVVARLALAWPCSHCDAVP